MKSCIVLNCFRKELRHILYHANNSITLHCSLMSVPFISIHESNVNYSRSVR